MKFILASFALLTVLACGTSPVADITPEIADNVVSPAAKISYPVVRSLCIDPTTHVATGNGKPTAEEEKCCRDAGCTPGSATNPTNPNCTAYFCDCGLGEPNGLSQASYNDTYYVHSQCYN